MMWLLVMFDLPVETNEEVKAANDFRKKLLDMGFERCQYSVYLRFLEGYQQIESFTNKVKSVLPDGGSVYALSFTDKQYENIVRFESKNRVENPKNPEPFQVF